uniref:Uncharacterized protein n=1 Tax=Oryza glumipatula TaxID=40148 RepID=A0A0E0AY75_9ORYZ
MFSGNVRVKPPIVCAFVVVLYLVRWLDPNWNRLYYMVFVWESCVQNKIILCS